MFRRVWPATLLPALPRPEAPRVAAAGVAKRPPLPRVTTLVFRSTGSVCLALRPPLPRVTTLLFRSSGSACRAPRPALPRVTTLVSSALEMSPAAALLLGVARGADAGRFLALRSTMLSFSSSRSATSPLLGFLALPSNSASLAGGCLLRELRLIMLSSRPGGDRAALLPLRLDTVTSSSPDSDVDSEVVLAPFSAVTSAGLVTLAGRRPRFPAGSSCDAGTLRWEAAVVLARAGRRFGAGADGLANTKLSANGSEDDDWSGGGGGGGGEGSRATVSLGRLRFEAGFCAGSDSNSGSSSSGGGGGDGSRGGDGAAGFGSFCAGGEGEAAGFGSFCAGGEGEAAGVDLFRAGGAAGSDSSSGSGVISGTCDWLEDGGDGGSSKHVRELSATGGGAETQHNQISEYSFFRLLVVYIFVSKI